MSNIIYAPFMELLRAGLWNRKPDIHYFPLTEDGWKELRRAGQKQTVNGILYDGMLLLPEDLQPSKEILYTWAAETALLELSNHKMNRTITELYSLFEREGIEVILQKGQGVAALYEDPLHRVCGDIDWYVAHPCERKKANMLVAALGAEVHYQADYSQMYVYNGIQVEHHSRMCDSHNPFVKKYLKELEDRECDQGLKLSVSGVKIRLPSALLCHLQVNMHILKHMLSFGVGLRQLCDSARICYKLHQRTNGSDLEQIYRKTGILRWILVLNELLCEELGLEERYLPIQRQKGLDYDWMMQDVWTGGNFGFYDNRYGGYDREKGRRRGVSRHWGRRFIQSLRLAPQETMWFPLTHLASNLARK